MLPSEDDPFRLRCCVGAVRQRDQPVRLRHGLCAGNRKMLGTAAAQALPAGGARRKVADARSDHLQQCGVSSHMSTISVEIAVYNP
jgi:hypothetical protein